MIRCTTRLADSVHAMDEIARWMKGGWAFAWILCMAASTFQGKAVEQISSKKKVALILLSCELRVSEGVRGRTHSLRCEIENDLDSEGCSGRTRLQR